MRITQPWMLTIFLPALAAIVVIARVGARTVSRKQHRWATAVRIGVTAILVLALAQPLLVQAVDERTVLFLLDRSDSVAASVRTQQEAIVAEALRAGGVTDRSGVAVFGTELGIDQSLQMGRAPVAVLTEVDGSATDLGGALRTAAALLPTEGSRRIVVLTDLVETTGSAREAARELGDLGIAIDVVSLDSQRSPDALIESVTAPPVVRQGETVPVRLVIRSTSPGAAVVTVRAGEQAPITIPVALVSGANEILVDVQADRTGPLAIEVDLEADFDTRPENDSAQGITRVLGAARLAVVEGKPGEGAALASGLAAAGYEVDQMISVPSAESLLEYDGVVLVNFARPGNEAAEALASYVEDLGRGLVVVGGDQAYGLGDYHKTPLESVLPVSSNPDDLVRRQPVAQVLVIDTSGSMAACHCNSSTPDTGINKTDISRAGAAAAIEALAATDRVGVLAFSSGTSWVLPLDRKPSAAAVTEALGTLTPEGDTEIAPALEEALASLLGAAEDLRHIVLFTDGWDPNEANLLPIVRSIADAGITLSVLGTGEGPGVTLQRMAEVGNGRYYPGTDITEVPELFVEETLTVARNLANEGSFFPALGARSPATEGLAESPPLLGYVLTKAKGSASVALEIGPGDPLLVTWQRGLGRVSAWTSDATARWSANWVDWEGYVSFWGAVVGDVLPAGRDNPPAVHVENGLLRIRLTDFALEDGSSAVARIRTPSGDVISVPLDRTGPSDFEGTVRAASAGAYWAAVSVDHPSGGGYTTGSGAVSGYQEEFAFREPDPTLGAEIADATSGRVNPSPAAMFDDAPSRGSAERALWPWLVGLALAGFLVDVALRRLVFGAGDVDDWRQGVTSQTKRERKRVSAVVEKRQANDDAKDEVASDSETLQRLMRRKTR